MRVIPEGGSAAEGLTTSRSCDGVGGGRVTSACIARQRSSTSRKAREVSACATRSSPVHVHVHVAHKAALGNEALAGSASRRHLQA